MELYENINCIFHLQRGLKSNIIKPCFLGIHRTMIWLPMCREANLEP